MDLLEVALTVDVAEQARGPYQAGAGISALQADFLRDVLLSVVDGRGRAVLQAGRQVNAGAVEHRIRNIERVGRKNRRIVLGLEVTEVIERAVVPGRVLAVVVRGVRDQPDRPQVALDLQSRE